MAISKIIYKSSANATPVTWMDVTQDTVTSTHLESNYTAHDASGTQITGTLVPGEDSGNHNAINYNTLTSGYRLRMSDGAIVSGSSYSVSDFIPVSPDSTVKINFYVESDSYGHIFYGSNKSTIISKVSFNTAHANGDSMTVPENAGYLRLTIPNTSLVSGSETAQAYVFTPPVALKRINFIDYDGTILYSYAKNSLSELPTNPSHPGLVSQGWNWTLQEINTLLSNCPGSYIYVGQMYTTSSGNTEIDIELKPGYLSPVLTLGVSSTVTIDWGDGSETETLSGSSLTTSVYKPHTYPKEGKYTIIISGGTFAFLSETSTAYPSVLRESSSNTMSRAYASDVIFVRMGSNARLGAAAFRACLGLKYITIPSTITSIGGDSLFDYCASLKSVTIPSSITDVGGRAFYTNLSLTTISLPHGLTSLTNIAFEYCYSLTDLVIPPSVTSIGTQVFRNNYSMKNYHFLSSTPPSLTSGAIEGIQSGTHIYVPYSSSHSILNAYKSASGWSSYSTYIQEETQ